MYKEAASISESTTNNVVADCKLYSGGEQVRVQHSELNRLLLGCRSTDQFPGSSITISDVVIQSKDVDCKQRAAPALWGGNGGGITMFAQHMARVVATGTGSVMFNYSQMPLCLRLMKREVEIADWPDDDEIHKPVEVTDASVETRKKRKRVSKPKAREKKKRRREGKIVRPAGAAATTVYDKYR